MSGNADADVPDFAAVYDGPDVARLAPRLAAQLWLAAGLLADTYRDPTAVPLLLDELPPIVGRVADQVWIDRFISCFDALAQRLGQGGFDLSRLATCTGEEMALHLVIATAEALADSGALEEQAWMAALPGHEDDVDFDVARDVLFRDHDVLELFEPSLDGVEDPSSAEARLRGFAHLHPRDWFVRFADC